MADIPATDAALDRGYVSAKLRTDLAAQGCTVHMPPKQGMLNPPLWDKAIYARRHRIENMFSRLKDAARIALRRDKTRRSWMGFVYLAAALINMRLDSFSHRPHDYSCVFQCLFVDKDMRRQMDEHGLVGDQLGFMGIVVARREEPNTSLVHAGPCPGMAMA